MLYLLTFVCFASNAMNSNGMNDQKYERKTSDDDDAQKRARMYFK